MTMNRPHRKAEDEKKAKQGERQRGREGGREGGKEGRREGGREGGREVLGRSTGSRGA
jgi:hypothetical protein